MFCRKINENKAFINLYTNNRYFVVPTANSFVCRHNKGNNDPVTSPSSGASTILFNRSYIMDTADSS